MIQAYRRGWLRRTHPFGDRSRLREDVLLETIDTELAANAAMRSTQMLATLLAPLKVDTDRRKKLMRDLTTDMDASEMLRISDFDGAQLLRFNNSSLAAGAVYDLLQQAGLVTGDGKSPSNEKDEHQ